VERGGELEISTLDALPVRALGDAEKRVVVTLVEIAVDVDDPLTELGLEVDVLVEAGAAEGIADDELSRTGAVRSAGGADARGTVFE
jgi:hypothetical protein